MSFDAVWQRGSDEIDVEIKIVTPPNESLIP
jgi:hypothetical protein